MQFPLTHMREVTLVCFQPVAVSAYEFADMFSAIANVDY